MQVQSYTDQNFFNYHLQGDDKKPSGQKTGFNYYPFGLKHTGYNNYPQENIYSNSYKYQYNGQELQDELGLNWLTYRYRNYDPAMGRFMGIDPISEDYYNITTYQFAHNSPAWKIEIEGLEGEPTTEEDIISIAGNIDTTQENMSEVVVSAPYPNQKKKRSFFGRVLKGVGSGFKAVNNYLLGVERNIGKGVVQSVESVVSEVSQIGEDFANGDIVDGIEGTLGLITPPGNTLVDGTEGIDLSNPDELGVEIGAAIIPILITKGKKARSPHRIGKRINFPTRKKAYETAKKASGGKEPIVERHGTGKPHYHKVDKKTGKRIKGDHDHYNFPKKQF